MFSVSFSYGYMLVLSQAGPYGGACHVYNSIILQFRIRDFFHHFLKLFFLRRRHLESVAGNSGLGLKKGRLETEWQCGFCELL